MDEPQIFLMLPLSLLYCMDAIEQLLEKTPKPQQEDYEAYLQTHLKLLMTGVSKAKVQDTTQVTIRKNQCLQQCYKRNLADTAPATW